MRAGAAKQMSPLPSTKCASSVFAAARSSAYSTVGDHVGEGPSAYVGVHPGFERVEASLALVEGDVDVGQGLVHHFEERVLGSEGERCGERGGSLVTEEALPKVDHGGMAGALVDSGPGGDRDGAARTGHTRHFGEGAGLIGEEHEGELADHPIEGLVGERKTLGWAASPGHGYGGSAGHAEHPVVDVDAGDRTGAVEAGAAVRARMPVPQPTSRTSSPAERAALSSSCSGHWSKRVGTKKLS